MRASTQSRAEEKKYVWELCDDDETSFVMLVHSLASRNPILRFHVISHHTWHLVVISNLVAA